MDWCNYKYARMSEMIQYTEIFHKFNNDQKNKVIINDDFWLDAMSFVADACNTSIQSEYKFINLHYFFHHLNSMLTLLFH